MHQVTDHLLEDGTFAAKLENIIHERITEIPNPSPTSKQVFMNTEPVREIVTSTIIDQVPQLVRATMIAELETLVLETIHTSIPRIQEAVKDELIDKIRREMRNKDYSSIRCDMHDIARDELRQYQANQNPPNDVS